MSTAARAFRGSTSGISRQRLRGLRWRRLTRDVYALAQTDPDRRLAAEAALVALPDAVLSHRTAAAALALPVDPGGSIHVTRPPGTAVSKRAGVTTHRATVPPADLVLVRGLRATSPVRTWLDLAGQLSLVELVVLGDAVARREGTAALATALGASPGRRGVVQARRALRLVDPGADSPAETRARLVLHQAGFRQLVHGVQIVDRAGHWLAAPDLADPAARVAVQYDGLVHLDPDQRRSDIARDELSRAMGWEVVVLLDRDLRQPHLAVEKVEAAYARATVRLSASA